MAAEKNGRNRFWLRSAGVAAAFVFLVIIVAVSAFLWFESQLDLASTSDPRIFIVPQGASINEVAHLLEGEGIIASSLLFRLHMRLAHRDVSIKAGEYRFSPPVTIRRIARQLIEGRVLYHRLTVREGLDWRETAAALGGKGFGTVEEYLSLVSDPALIGKLDPGAENLEGYLFPETYSVARGTTPGEIVEMMVARFREIWNQEFQARAEVLGMSVREVVTLASLIEKETALPEERPLVSSVFHNRLRLGMKLACDPTVIYAVKRVKPWDGIIHRSDLELDSPYNTYLYPGLPPGPIANTGLESIRSALYPADTSHLFFVSRNDGSHVFSDSYADHAQAVNKYQR